MLKEHIPSVLSAITTIIGISIYNHGSDILTGSISKTIHKISEWIWRRSSITIPSALETGKYEHTSSECYVCISRFVFNHLQSQYAHLSVCSISGIEKLGLYNEHQKTYDIKYKGQMLTFKLVSCKNENETWKKMDAIEVSANVRSGTLYNIVQSICKEEGAEMKKQQWKLTIQVDKSVEMIKEFPRSFDSIFLEKDIKEDLIDDINNFLTKEKWYKDHGIPYRRSYLFSGPPGTGKTSMVEAMAHLTHRKIKILRLTDIISDSHLAALVLSIEPETILLIEDIDASSNIVRSRNHKLQTHNVGETTFGELAHLIDSRRKEEKGIPPLTLSGMLNALDGVSVPDGIIFVLTTNHVEHLDRAVIRPGRIDRRLELENCSMDRIRKMYEFYHNRSLPNEDEKYFESHTFSPAEIMGICSRISDRLGDYQYLQDTISYYKQQNANEQTLQTEQTVQNE